MKKFIILLFIFLFIILPIAIVGIVAADVYLTVSGFDINQVGVDVSTPSVGLSSDNTTLDFSTNVSITLPSGGFIPKGVVLTIQLMQDSVTLGDPTSIEVALGETTNNVINQSITLTQDLTDSITQGGSVEITLKSSASISILGFAIPYSFNIPDQNFSIP